MSYDGIVMRAVALELDRILAGGRIDKIYQPTRNEICLLIRKPGRTFRLLLSAAAAEPGVYLLGRQPANPPEPPLFCMLLRKHLEGGRILSFVQQGLDRIMEIRCETTDELGELSERTLIIEIMGKHSNIILSNRAHGKIVDAIHRVTPALSRYRQVLPGLDYQPPPPQNKITPWCVDQEAFYRQIMSFSLSQSLSKILLASFAGLGPQSAAEIVKRSGLDPSQPLEYCGEYELSRLWQTFRRTAVDIAEGTFFPEVIVQDGTPLTFSALALTGYPAEMRRCFSGMNEALDFYYTHKRHDNLITQKKAGLAQLIKKETERCEKKSDLQLATINEYHDSEKYRLWGELLVAHHHSLQPADEVEVPDFYHPGADPVRIPLDKDLSIMDNAQFFFKKYRKTKNAAGQARLHYDETMAELEYLNSLSASLDNVTSLGEIEEIREEMKDAGYIKAAPLKRPAKGQAVKKEVSLPQKLTLDGWEVYIGKNNRQNDYLVTKIAKPEDIWLHTKNIPGSHVIIRNPAGIKVPDHILEQAARLAAGHSQARFSANVPVDYTLRKHVWKIKGAKPGMVHYENQRTIYVTPASP